MCVYQTDDHHAVKFKQQTANSISLITAYSEQWKMSAVWHHTKNSLVFYIRFVTPHRSNLYSLF